MLKNYFQKWFGNKLENNLKKGLLDFIEEPIIVFSENLDIVYTNQAFLGLLHSHKKFIPETFLKENPPLLEFIKTVKIKKEKMNAKIPIFFTTKNKKIFIYYQVKCILIDSEILCFLKTESPQHSNFFTLTEYLPLGVLIHQNQKIVYINESGLSILKANDKKEIMGKSIIEFVDKDYHNIIQERIQKIYEQDIEAPPIEEKLLTINKEPFYAEVRAKKILWNNIPAILVIFQDITKSIHKRKFSENSLILLQKIIQENNIQLIIKELLNAFEIILQSRLTCIWFDYYQYNTMESAINNPENIFIISNISEDKDFHKKYIIDFLSIEDSPIKKTIESKKTIFYRNVLQEINTHKLKDIFINNSISSYWCIPFINQNGICYGVLVCYFEEPQDLIHFEIEYLFQLSFFCSIMIEKLNLEKENYLLSQVSRKSSDYLFLFNDENSIIWYNKKFKELYPEIKKNMYIIDIIKKLIDSNSQKEQIIKKILKRESFQFEFETTIRSCKYYFNLIFDSIKDFSIKPKYYCILEDITKEIEYEKQLIEAKNRAEKNEKIKSEFLSIMSHEIRTPLNVILGIIQILLQNNPREDQLEDLQLLKSSSEYLYNLLNDILDYSKIEAKKIELNNSNFSLKELIENILEILHHQIEEKNLKLNFYYDENIPMIFADKTRITQIFMNLITNSIKFTNEGGIAIRVNKINETKDHVFVQIQIEDTGKGIPEEFMEKIYEPFTQLDTKPSRKHYGSGLGLAITKKLIELFNGKIEIFSQLYKGTTITIEIPFSKSIEIQEATIKNENFDKKQLKILIVEDYYPNLLITKKFLEIWKIQTDFATNGEEAIYKAKNYSYDLILMDLHMPGIDGYTATKKIREFDSNIPIIAITASSLDEISDKIKETGLTDALIKPFKPEELYKKIIEHSFKKIRKNS